jgi:hypothetical protein
MGPCKDASLGRGNTLAPGVYVVTLLVLLLLAASTPSSAAAAHNQNATATTISTGVLPIFSSCNAFKRSPAHAAMVAAAPPVVLCMTSHNHLVGGRGGWRRLNRVVDPACFHRFQSSPANCTLYNIDFA